MTTTMTPTAGMTTTNRLGDIAPPHSRPCHDCSELDAAVQCVCVCLCVVFVYVCLYVVVASPLPFFLCLFLLFLVSFVVSLVVGLLRLFSPSFILACVHSSLARSRIHSCMRVFIHSCARVCCDADAMYVYVCDDHRDVYLGVATLHPLITQFSVILDIFTELTDMTGVSRLLHYTHVLDCHACVRMRVCDAACMHVCLSVHACVCVSAWLHGCVRVCLPLRLFGCLVLSSPLLFSPLLSSFVSPLLSSWLASCSLLLCSFSCGWWRLHRRGRHHRHHRSSS